MTLLLIFYVLVGAAIIFTAWFRSDLHYWRRWLLPVVITTVLTVGGQISIWQVSRADQRMREQIIRQANEIAHTISPALIQSLSFSSDDRQHPIYQRLCSQMKAAVRFMNCRSMYSVALRNGQLLFGPESLDEKDPLASVPGSAYKEPPTELIKIFNTRKGSVVGPYKDEFGSFVSSYMPIIDNQSGKVLMVIGLDVLADDWNQTVTKVRLSMLGYAMLLAAAILIAQQMLIWRKSLPESGQQRYRHLESLFTAILGLILTVGLVYYSVDKEKRSQLDAFYQIAYKHGADLEDAFRDLQNDLQGIASFMSVKGEVNRDEFREYVTHLVVNSAIQSVAWAPRTANTEKRALHSSRLGALHGSQKGDESQEIKSDDNPLFSTWYIEHLRGNNKSPGFDPGTDPVRQAAIAEALHSRSPTAIAPAKLHQGSNDEASLLLMAPLFQSETVPKGLVLFSLKILPFMETTIKTAFNIKDPVSLTLFLVPETAAPVQIGTLPANTISQLKRESLISQELSETFPLFVFGRTFAVVVTPNKAFLSAHPARNGWIITVSGLLITLFGSMFVASLAKDRRHLEARVAERTAELLLSKENLRISEERHRLLAENAVDSIWIMGLDGKFTYISPSIERLTGHSQAEFLQRSMQEILTPDSLSIAEKILHRMITDAELALPVEDFRGELELYCKDGSITCTEVTTRAVLDINGKIVELVGVSRDITEKKSIMGQLIAAKEQADKANRAKSQFLAIMSHEIRTPMNGVIGMSSILLDTELTSEQREFDEILRRSGENLLELINDILDFSKIESGKLELEMINFDLQLTLDDITQLMTHRADEAGLQLSCRIEPTVPLSLKGDPGKVRQVITNLVGNAMKFTKRGSVAINLSLVSDQDGYVTIRFAVSDTGIGIPKHRLKAIFDPFTQVDASTTRKYGGTGLGLSICRQLAELMGGEIGVTSEEGKGSTFWFTARLEKQNSIVVEASHPAAAQTREVTPRTPDKIEDLSARILLVEDNIFNQKIAEVTIKALGYTLDVAGDGQQAVEALTRTNYDLVLMDCMMPVMDGFAATAAIRSETSKVLNRNIPIIAMTANAMNEDREKCLAAGMDDFVSKPAKKGELGTILEKWIASAHLLRKKTIDVATQDLDRLKNLTVLYVEDDDETRNQFSLFLSRIVGVLITAKDGAEGLTAYQEHHPDIIITDIKMPLMDGDEMLKHVRTLNTSIPAIVLSAFEMPEGLKQYSNFEMLQKPASGKMLEETLRECVRQNISS